MNTHLIHHQIRSALRSLRLAKVKPKQVSLCNPKPNQNPKFKPNWLPGQSKIFQKIDHDGSDGEVNKHEFLAFFSNQEDERLGLGLVSE